MAASPALEKTIARWHQFVRAPDPATLDDLLHDDVVFLSPVVFTPQEGKALTSMYLQAAFMSLGGDTPTEGSDTSGGSFRYVKEMLDGHHATLEFETSVDGKYINGVDIISVDDEGRITEFKVMIRPLQAVNAVHAQMKAMLESMG